MSTPSSTISGFRHIPDYILDQIASYSAEPALWRIMAASWALREAGEKELRGYLVKQKVTHGETAIYARR
jgi:hypothetical protein